MGQKKSFIYENDKNQCRKGSETYKLFIENNIERKMTKKCNALYYKGKVKSNTQLTCWLSAD